MLLVAHSVRLMFMLTDSVFLTELLTSNYGRLKMRFLSFSKLEKKLLPQHRNRLNHAESVEDVKKFFFYTVKELFEKGFNGSLNLSAGDISLSLQTAPYFNVSQEIQGRNEFDSSWKGSDLSVILQRLATSSVHRYQHLQGNPLKTRLKIKGH